MNYSSLRCELSCKTNYFILFDAKVHFLELRRENNYFDPFSNITYKII